MWSAPTISRPLGAISLIAAVLLCAAPAIAAVPGDHCYAGWSEAVPVVQREALTAVRDLHAQARQRKVGDVVRITLCAERGRFVYRLLVREPLGRVVPLTVDARRPFEP